MLGFFFEHYDSIVNRYIIYDDGSTDGSLEILHQHPKVEVRQFHRVIEDSYVLSAQIFHNSVWRESQGVADWVILTAIDEHLVHDDLADYLKGCLANGSTIIPALGFQMISEIFPEPDQRLCNVITTGAPFPKMSKLCIFRPEQIDETNYAVGRHSADPQGNIVLPDKDEVFNLHYKYLDFDRLARRHEVLASGLGSKDKENGFGHRYHFDADQLRSDWNTFQAQAVDISAPGFDALACHENVTWWRNRKPPYLVSKPHTFSNVIRWAKRFLHFDQ